MIRFRQMGDTILATPMLNSLRLTFPNATIDLVLNAKIAPLFEGHPAISRIITFTDEERHHTFAYMKKVWHTVHETPYDVIIDMRSTANTMLFALFSPSARWRIGIRKPYTRLAFNHFVDACADNESMIDHNMKLIRPLQAIRPLQYERNISLCITDKEKGDFRQYMQQQGIDLSRPVALIGVTAKLENKTWSKERMAETLQRLIRQYPDLQLIFNYAPGQEEKNAREIYETIGAPQQVFINVQARSSRELAAMAANITFYFGNEGGGRHIVQAMGRPSLVVCSPTASKTTWLPSDGDVTAEGIAASDLATPEQLRQMDAMQRYDLITVDIVWQRLLTFCQKFLV